MLRNAFPFLLLAMFSTQSHAAGFDIRLSNETAEATFLTENATFGYGGADIGMGVFFNEDDDVLANGSILVSGSGTGDVRALHFGVGGKVLAGRLDNSNGRILGVPDDSFTGGALAIGGHLRYVFPANMPFAVLIEGFWAPEVTNFSDFKGLAQYRFGLELEVTPSARAYVGYGKTEVELANKLDYKVEDNAHVGVRFTF